ncbi:MAG: isoprenyl transferase [Candidatus Marinimicrobia bacterium]|nr:isoprenyl transferase [Candidatus Neomarinimicrobiota bacterium]MBL7023382.1 isoprenyl transferase [Candidatus Neomarinimicrobiota bacterium]MBL7109737.1 isoprenyl transferase [Candidatus Neomarinimicrobiota bacterium]
MKIKKQIDINNIPNHIAIIMDGNGRWANTNGLPRMAGHREGVKTVKNITQLCGELGIKELTLYTFSSENWERPKTEVSALMTLFIQSLRREINDLMKNNVKLTTIGSTDNLPKSVETELIKGVEKTNNNSGLNLNLAFNYGSRQEIIRATKNIGRKLLNDQLTIEQIDEQQFSKHLYTQNMADPDLLIRTGGEFRISNFMLWQIAYTELYITNTFWPDFSKVDLINAISDYQSRERRFGLTSEQIKENND